MCATTGVSLRVVCSRVSLEWFFLSLRLLTLLFSFHNSVYPLLSLICILLTSPLPPVSAAFLISSSAPLRVSLLCLSLSLFAVPQLSQYLLQRYCKWAHQLSRVFLIESATRSWRVIPPPPPTGKVTWSKILVLPSNHLLHLSFKDLAFTNVFLFCRELHQIINTCLPTCCCTASSILAHQNNQNKL